MFFLNLAQNHICIRGFYTHVTPSILMNSLVFSDFFLDFLNSIKWNVSWILPLDHVKDIERLYYLLKTLSVSLICDVFSWVSIRTHYKESLLDGIMNLSFYNLTLSVFFFSFFLPFLSVCISVTLIGTITVQCLLALLPAGPQETGTFVSVCVC